MQISSMQISRRMMMLALAAVLVAAGGCNDDEPGLQPTLDNVWPHTDGSSWTYDLTYRIHTFEAVDEGDELPDMADLRADLLRAVDGDPETVESGTFTLAFDGMTTTGSGVVAQDLVETWEDDDGSKAQPTSGDRTRRLLRIHDLVRPQAVAKVAALADSFARVLAWPGPLFMSGGAFAYEGTGYYGYGDIYSDRSWVYLEGQPARGRTFSLQLLRGVVDDLWLQGEIWRVGNIRVGGTAYRNAVECMYLIDFGTTPLTDEDGEVTGQVRSYVYGHIFYVPELGPVGTRERSRVLMRTAYNPEGTGEKMVIDLEAWLVEADLAEE